jgi:hypothetical protein
VIETSCFSDNIHRPRTDCEAAIAVGLMAGVIEGVGLRGSHLEIGHEAAKKLDLYLREEARKDLQEGLDGLAERNGLYAVNGDVAATRVFVLAMNGDGLTDTQWERLQDEFGDNQSLFVVFQDVLTQSERESFTALAKRDPNIWLGAVQPVGENLRLTLISSTEQPRRVDLAPSTAPDHGFSLGR